MRLHYAIFFVALLWLGSCGKKPEKNTEQAAAEPQPEPPKEVVLEKNPVSEYEREIKEALFLYFRSEVDGLGTYRFLKYEDIEFSGDEVTYTIVTIPESEVDGYAQQNKLMTSSIIPTSFSNEQMVNRNDDTTRIEGTVEILELVRPDLEADVSSIKIGFYGGWMNSTLSMSPYGYGEERDQIFDGYEAELIVNVVAPRIYSRDQLHIKARIFELTEEDVVGMDKEDMGYLRNELFARHGHTFKTDKMQEYFAKQPWYRPYTDDATDWLNETEKKNAQFIRQLEARV